MIFGSHVNNVNNNLANVIKSVKKAGGNAIQIFVDVDNDVNNDIDNDIDNIVIHSSYKHNIAKKWDTRSWWIVNIIKEIFIANKLHSKYLVLHLGKKLDLPIKDCYNNMYTSLLYIYSQTKNINVQILLETSSGQGSELCYNINDLAHFYNKIKYSNNKNFSNKIKLCLDTCHIFAAGYNIKTKNNCKLFLEMLNELIDIDNIKVIHMNDSTYDIGENIDRHANIDDGYIGYIGLKYIFDYFVKLDKIIILETPNNGYIKEFDMLKYG
jgi:deoxyribonuclease-4